MKPWNILLKEVNKVDYMDSLLHCNNKNLIFLINIIYNVKLKYRYYKGRIL